MAMEMTVGIDTVVSVGGVLASVAGAWYVAQWRLRQMETRADKIDARADRMEAACHECRGNLHTRLNGVQDSYRTQETGIVRAIHELKEQITETYAKKSEVEKDLAHLRQDMQRWIVDLDNDLRGLREGQDGIGKAMARLAGEMSLLRHAHGIDTDRIQREDIH